MAMPTDFFEGAAASFNDRIEASLLNGIIAILHECAEKGDFEGFKTVLDQSLAKYPEKAAFFLSGKAANGKMLIDAIGAQTELPPDSVSSISTGKKQILDMCLAQPDITAEQIPPILCRFADYGDFKSFKDLFATASAKFPTAIAKMLNGTDGMGDTPFICAIHPDGAFPDEDATPASPERIKAVLAGSAEIIDFCFAQPELDINIAGLTGTTPIMWANETQRTSVALQLYRYPHLITACEDDYGDTDLIIAVESGIPELVEAALRRDGANVHILDGDERDAIFYAEELAANAQDESTKAAAEQILSALKSHSSYRPPAPKPESQPVTPKKGRRAAATEEVTKDARKTKKPLTDTSAADGPEGFKSAALKAMANKYPFPHSLALLHWIDRRGGESLQSITQQIRHEGKGIRVPTLLAFISSADLYANGSKDRTTYEPKFLSICQHIEYDPAANHPLRSGMTTSVKPSDKPSI